MFATLKRSYPLCLDTKGSVKTSAWISAFVFLFLVFFQPFGLSDDEPKFKYILIIGYSTVCFLVQVANVLLVPRILKNIFIEDNWTVLKEIIWDLWIVFSIGLGIYVFICIFDAINDYFRLGFLTFVLFQLMTFVIALFPITAVTMLKQFRLLKKNIEEANGIASSLRNPRVAPVDPEQVEENQMVALYSGNRLQRHDFIAHNLFCISAEGNYVDVLYKDKEIKSVLIRNTLKNIERQLKDYPVFFRCHRSFIVNIRRIAKAEGNAQGVRLTIEGLERKITVSRSYYNKFKKLLKHLESSPMHSPTPSNT